MNAHVRIVAMLTKMAPPGGDRLREDNADYDSDYDHDYANENETQSEGS